MRFSLRDLLLFVAFCAGIAWCAAQIGFDTAPFWSVIGVSAVLSGVFVYFARREQNRRRALFVLVPALAISSLFLAVSLFINSILLSIATVVLAGGRPRTAGPLWAIAGTSTLISLLAVVLPSMAYKREIEQALNDIPRVTLVNRLQYERRRTETATTRMSLSNASVSTCLGEFEQQLMRTSVRKRDFLILHERQYRSFQSALGFGVARMVPLTPESLRRPPLHDIKVDDTVREWGRRIAPSWVHGEQNQ
jgi:hypothetical protein